MPLYGGTCGWSSLGWSTLLSTLAKAYITLRFLCGKEPLIGGVVCLRTRGSKLSPLDTIYCATLINSPAFSFNYLENSAVLPEWLFYSLVVFCSVLWRWTNITFLEARPLNTFGFIYLWMWTTTEISHQLLVTNTSSVQSCVSSTSDNIRHPFAWILLTRLFKTYSFTVLLY